MLSRKYTFVGLPSSAKGRAACSAASAIVEPTPLRPRTHNPGQGLEPDVYKEYEWLGRPAQDNRAWGETPNIVQL